MNLTFSLLSELALFGAQTLRCPLVDVTEAEREQLLEDVRTIRALPRSERRLLLSGIRVLDADRRHGRGRKIPRQASAAKRWLAFPKFSRLDSPAKPFARVWPSLAFSVSRAEASAQEFENRLAAGFRGSAPKASAFLN